MALIAQGRFQEALDLIREAIPFPGICGRICTHPCELNCRRAEVDEPVSIRLLKRFVSDWELEQVGQGQQSGRSRARSPIAPMPERRVAVVGAGPGGMAVADNLARQGYRVTVFETLPVVGGMMAIGIPAYRLPREVIAREVPADRATWASRSGSTRAIGPGGAHTLDDLFDAGLRGRLPGRRRPPQPRAAHPRRGPAGRGPRHRPAEDHQPVAADWTIARWQMQVLQRSCSAARPPGWPSSAAATRPWTSPARCRRLGVDDVRILYRRTRAEMPAMPEEIEEAEHEGVPIEFLVSPVRILGDAEQRRAGLECVRMKLGEPDTSGRRRPVPIAGSEFTLELDLVVLAIGQAPDLGFLGAGAWLRHHPDERINVDGLSVYDQPARRLCRRRRGHHRQDGRHRGHRHGQTGCGRDRRLPARAAARTRSRSTPARRPSPAGR